MPESSHTSDLLTAAEVCQIAKVSRDTVARWARQGTLPVAMQLPGGQRRFRREDVDALLEPKAAS